MTICGFLGFCAILLATWNSRFGKKFEDDTQFVYWIIKEQGNGEKKIKQVNVTGLRKTFYKDLYTKFGLPSQRTQTVPQRVYGDIRSLRAK